MLSIWIMSFLISYSMLLVVWFSKFDVLSVWIWVSFGRNFLTTLQFPLAAMSRNLYLIPLWLRYINVVSLIDLLFCYEIPWLIAEILDYISPCRNCSPSHRGNHTIGNNSLTFLAGSLKIDSNTCFFLCAILWSPYMGCCIHLNDRNTNEIICSSSIMSGKPGFWWQRF